VAVMVLWSDEEVVLLRASLFLRLAAFVELGSLTIWKLWLLLLRRLEELTSLGAGLKGGLWSPATVPFKDGS